jgi:hypothetical protein
MGTDFTHLGFRSLTRRPVLTAMMVYSIGLAVAGFAVWRVGSNSPNPRMCGKPYLVQATAEIAGRDDAFGAAANGEIRQASLAS